MHNTNDTGAIQNKSNISKMNKINITAITAIILAVAMFAGCKANTYAQKRKDEKNKFSSYVSRNKLNLSSDSAYCFSQPLPWPENLYFKTYRGAYIRLVEDDTTQRKPAAGNGIIIRFKSYDLDGRLVGDNTDPSQSWEGYGFVYTPQSAIPCIGWNDCVACMHHNSRAVFLIDSTLGQDEQLQQVVTLRIEITDFTVRND